MLKDTISNVEQSIAILEQQVTNLKEYLEELKRIAAEESSTVEDLDEKWLTSTEAAEMYSKSADTFRKAIFYKNLVEGVDCKKVGKSWLFLKSSLDRVYGDNK